MSIDDTLKERGKVYGEFRDYALIAGTLNRVIQNRIDDSNNDSLEWIHIEALKMIVSKISRIISGDPNHVDNWHDIAGYATLVENEIKKNS